MIYSVGIFLFVVVELYSQHLELASCGSYYSFIFDLSLNRNAEDIFTHLSL